MVFPTVVPYILVNFVYTMIDIFVSYDNAVMRWISDLTGHSEIVRGRHGPVVLSYHHGQHRGDFGACHPVHPRASEGGGG